MASYEANEAIRKQILGEKTSSLAIATQALEAALEDLAAAAAGTAEARRDALADAAERLWYVVVQREAMGLSRHEVLFETLRVRREVRFAMGPRRRRAR
jgi:response regulator RpfG family c-di-GMP phosphodiesterase